MTGNDNTIEIPIPEPKDVTTVVQAPREELEHVVAHEGRITQLESRLQQHQEEVYRQIAETRTSLETAIATSHDQQATMLESKLSRLEELATKLEQQVVEVPQEAIDEMNDNAPVAVPLVPEVESVPGAVQAAQPKGLRLRRKAKHSNHDKH